MFKTKKNYAILYAELEPCIIDVKWKTWFRSEFNTAMGVNNIPRIPSAILCIMILGDFALHISIYIPGTYNYKPANINTPNLKHVRDLNDYFIHIMVAKRKCLIPVFHNVSMNLTLTVSSSKKDLCVSITLHIFLLLVFGSCFVYYSPLAAM